MPDFSLTQILILVVLALLFLFPARGLDWILRREKPSAPASTTVTPSDANAPRLRFCTECGSQVDASRRFCTKCGTAIARSRSM